MRLSEKIVLTLQSIEEHGNFLFGYAAQLTNFNIHSLLRYLNAKILKNVAISGTRYDIGYRPIKESF